MPRERNPMGFEPDFRRPKYYQSLGENSIIFGTLDATKKPKQGVLSKYLKGMHGERLSTGYETFADFRKEVIAPLEFQMEELEKYFSPHLPPFYLEAFDPGTKDAHGNTEAMAILYQAEIVKKAELTSEDRLLYAKQIDDFLAASENFYNNFRMGASYERYLPDIDKPENFAFGHSSEQPTDQMYLIDIYPPTLMARGRWAEDMVSNVVSNFESELGYGFPKGRQFLEKLKRL